MSYFLETAWESRNHEGEELCGDTVLTTTSDQGSMLILSDGLGSGVKANILSTLTGKILQTMITAGAPLEDVVETVASTLPICKERHVAYSTFTLLQVGVNGEAYFVEYDNPSVILMRNGRSVPIPWEEELISGKFIRSARLTLELGDMPVIFSDGVTHAGVGIGSFGWMRDGVERFLTQLAAQGEVHAAQAVTRVLEECGKKYSGSFADDTTVAALRLIRPVPACVMVGPPSNPAMDWEVVDRLMACEGLRIVCGGTTSGIVSKYLGEEARIDLSYLSPDVPPIATMPGIDLVTEGVITIGLASRILKEYAETGDRSVLLRRRDGACLLAQRLAEDCTSVCFLVGRALNPAHQDPRMSIDLSIKLRLVEQMADSLRSLGKPVEIRYDCP